MAGSKQSIVRQGKQSSRGRRSQGQKGGQSSRQEQMQSGSSNKSMGEMMDINEDEY